MHEALGQEPPEQPLDDPVLEVEVHDLVVDVARVVEDDTGRIGACAPPLPRALFAALAAARSVSSVSAQVGSAPGRRSSAGNARTRVRCGRSVDRTRAARRRGARATPRARSRKLPFVQIQRSLASCRGSPELVDLPLQSLAYVTRPLELLGRATRCSSPASEICACSAIVASLAWRDAGSQACGSRPSSSTGGEAAQLASGSSSCLRTSTSRTRSFGAGRRRSSGSAPRARAGACGRCGRCAAPSGVGFHGTSKWKRSAQWFWRLTPSRAASVAMRMRSGCSAGSALKARLISSRAVVGHAAVEGRDALVRAVGRARCAAPSCCSR